MVRPIATNGLAGGRIYLCSSCGTHRDEYGEAESCCTEPKKLTGGSSSHYVIDVYRPLEGSPYRAQCLDIITTLNMTFAEGEAFKALWRKAAARLGNGKPGNTALYDAEKVKFYGETMVRLEGDA